MRAAAFACLVVLAATLAPGAHVVAAQDSASDTPESTNVASAGETTTNDASVTSAPGPGATSRDPGSLDPGSLDLAAGPVGDEHLSNEHPSSERAAVDADERRPGEDVVSSIEGVLREQTTTTPAPPARERPPRLAWRPEWSRFSFDEAILTLGLTSLLVAAELLPNATTAPNFGGMVIDDAVRDGMRLRLSSDRDLARAASDVLQGINIGMPFLFDALLVTGIGDGAWESAFQMGLIAIEAYVVTLVVWRITSSLARRERPIVAECNAGDPSGYCADARAPQSFYSAHAANAWTGAGLTCLFHTSMSTFGDEAADGTACGTAVAFAALGGVLRIMSDSEYMTDVVVGAALGFVSGYVLPWLLHFQGRARPELVPATSAFVPLPMVTSDTYGVQVIGIL